MILSPSSCVCRARCSGTCSHTFSGTATRYPACEGTALGCEQFLELGDTTTVFESFTLALISDPPFTFTFTCDHSSLDAVPGAALQNPCGGASEMTLSDTDGFDPHIAGAYTFTYTGTDASGTAYSITRLVNVPGGLLSVNIDPAAVSEANLLISFCKEAVAKLRFSGSVVLRLPRDFATGMT